VLKIRPQDISILYMFMLILSTRTRSTF